MISIVSASQESSLLSEYFTLVEEEWNNRNNKALFNSNELPSPILAIENEQLLGGLSFIDYPSPESGASALWINSLLVLPSHRGKGTGSKLVAAAENAAVERQANELFVYTEVREFYEKLGWSVSKNGEEGLVLKKRFQE